MIPTSTLSDFSVSDRSGISPVSMAAFNSEVSEPYEFFGKIAYDHFKFRAGHIGAFDYLNAAIRNGFETNFNSIKNADGGKSIAQIADECVSQGAMTSAQSSIFKSYFADLLSKADSETFATFGSTWNYILQKEVDLTSGSASNPNDIVPTIIASTCARNLLKYQFESQVLAPTLSGGTVDERGGGCFLGVTAQCWFDKLGKAALDAVKAATTTGFAVGNASNNGGGSSNFSWSAFWGSLKVGGSLGLIIGTITAFTDPSCNCTTPPPPSATCGAPAGVDILVADCSNTITASARIVGINPNSTSWTITNGILPDFSNASNPNGIANPNNFTIQGTFLRITPINENLPTNIAVANMCPGTLGLGLPAMAYNIKQIVRDPGTLFVNGPTQSSVGQTNVYTLSGTGLSSINANNSTTFGCSFHGTVVPPSSSSSISVKWNTSSTGGSSGGWGGSSPAASVNATSHNACSGLSNGSYIAVVVN